MKKPATYFSSKRRGLSNAAHAALSVFLVLLVVLVLAPVVAGIACQLFKH